VVVAKTTCPGELSESGRRSRISQLGLEGESMGFDGLSHIAGWRVSASLKDMLLEKKYIELSLRFH
jgi:hypothetical protein